MITLWTLLLSLLFPSAPAFHPIGGPIPVVCAEGTRRAGQPVDNRPCGKEGK